MLGSSMPKAKSIVSIFNLCVTETPQMGFRFFAWKGTHNPDIDSIPIIDINPV